MSTNATTAAPSPPRGFRTRTKVIVLAVLLLPVAGFSLYTWASLRWSYSEGERAGIVQKFSRKGWVCKTWEGELAMSTVPGSAPTIWSFTVRDEATAKLVTMSMGHTVALHYREHRGVPTSCFGETSYFVDTVRIVQ